MKNFTKPRFFIILILVILGIIMSFDLSYIFYKTNFLDVFAPSFCSTSELIDCDGVALTPYSMSFGVPNALWGIFVYSIILMLLFVDKIQEKFKNTIFDVFENPRSYIATLSLLTFALSMILASISIFKIHKICIVCFGTYFVDLFIALTARTKGFFVEDIKTTVRDFIKGAKNHFVLFIILLICFISLLTYLSKSLVLSPKLKKERTMKEFFDAKYNKYAVKGNTLGDEKADVVIKIYSDFNCPFCRVVNIMLHKLVREKKVLIEDVNYPLDTTCNHRINSTLGGHENSCLYAQYALAAKKQGKYWGMANLLFDKHPQSREELIEFIKKSHLGLDIDQLTSDAHSPEILKQLEDDIETTYLKAINGTPAIEINDVVYIGSMPYDELIEKVKLAQIRAKN